MEELKTSMDTPRVGTLLTIFFISSLVYAGCLFLSALASALIPLPHGAWEKLTTPGQNLYDPMWKPSLLLDRYGILLLLVLSVWQVALFFFKKRLFLVIAQVLLLTNALIQGCRYFIDLSIPYIASLDNTSFYANVAYGVGSAIIWVPYLRSSRRARRIFVR